MFNCLFKQAGETYKLFIYDNVRRDGFWSESETSAKYVAEKLSEIPDGSTLEVHINSDGGDAFEGTAIYNLLKNAPVKKIGIVDGHAFSAATFILQGCDERVMETGTTLLVHNAWTFAAGNAKELRAIADDLDKLMDSNRKIYLERCSLDEDELKALMEEDRILSPEEALEYGFVDRISAKAQEEDPKDPEEDPQDPGTDPDPKPEEDPEEDPAALRGDRFNAALRFFKNYY